MVKAVDSDTFEKWWSGTPATEQTFGVPPRLNLRQRESICELAGIDKGHARSPFSIFADTTKQEILEVVNKQPEQYPYKPLVQDNLFNVEPTYKDKSENY